MTAINDVTTTPVLRPVVTMDKTEIIALAEKIDTFDLSIMPFEDCCTIFAPPRPKTKPNLDRARQYEAVLDGEPMMARAIAGIKITTIHPQDEFMNAHQEETAALL
jgi:thiamine biosynthesis protein ThiI